MGVGERASPESLAGTDARVASAWKGDLRGSRWLCDASAFSAFFHNQKPSNPHRSSLQENQCSRHACWLVHICNLGAGRGGQGQGRGDEFQARLATQGEPLLQNKDVKYNRHS